MHKDILGSCSGELLSLAYMMSLLFTLGRFNLCELSSHYITIRPGTFTLPAAKADTALSVPLDT
jgi:hypothetical protein